MDVYQILKKELDAPSNFMSVLFKLKALQLPLIRQGYEDRCNAMIRAIKELMPIGSFTNPTGGLFVWYETSNKNFDLLKIIQKAIDNDVVYVPGIAFYPQNGFAITEESELVRCERPTNTMRLGYSLLSPDMIREGMKVLGTLLRMENKRKIPRSFSSFLDKGFFVI